MTYKSVAYTIHAADQMKDRGITTWDVRHILAIGEEQPIWTRPGGERRHLKVASIRGRDAGVVYAENAQRILIITVEWIE